jgi:hypothetical protein
LLERAVAIWEQTPKSGHPNVAAVLSNLAQIYARQSKDRRAEVLFQQALRLSEAYLGVHHPQTAQVLADFAVFHETQGTP